MLLPRSNPTLSGIPFGTRQIDQNPARVVGFSCSDVQDCAARGLTRLKRAMRVGDLI